MQSAATSDNIKFDLELFKIYDGTKQCPINFTLKVVGNKFALLILRNMIYFKQNRFNQFLNSIEEINTRALTNRLKEMEQDGLIERRIFNEHPVKIEYYPTKKGLALKPLLDMLAGYSLTYFGKEVKDGKKRTLSQIIKNGK
ncbi:MAG: helix-turn-helix domain-containing protein [Thermoproteota archaeon]